MSWTLAVARRVASPDTSNTRRTMFCAPITDIDASFAAQNWDTLTNSGRPDESQTSARSLQFLAPTQTSSTAAWSTGAVERSSSPRRMRQATLGFSRAISTPKAGDCSCGRSFARSSTAAAR